MIRKLNLEILDKIITSSSNGTLISVNIYRPTRGKNKGEHMVDYKISPKYIVGGNINNDTHREFSKVVKEVRTRLHTDDYAFMDLNYVVDAQHLNYRIVTNN